MVDLLINNHCLKQITFNMSLLSFGAVVWARNVPSPTPPPPPPPPPPPTREGELRDEPKQRLRRRLTCHGHATKKKSDDHDLPNTGWVLYALSYEMVSKAILLGSYVACILYTARIGVLYGYKRRNMVSFKPKLHHLSLFIKLFLLAAWRIVFM